MLELKFQANLSCLRRRPDESPITARHDGGNIASLVPTSRRRGPAATSARERDTGERRATSAGTSARLEGSDPVAITCRIAARRLRSQPGTWEASVGPSQAPRRSLVLARSGHIHLSSHSLLPAPPRATVVDRFNSLRVHPTIGADSPRNRGGVRWPSAFGAWPMLLPTSTTRSNS